MVQFRSHTCKLGSLIAMVLVYFIVELVIGHVLSSLTLIADSFHMLSDFIALVIGIAARRISKWPKSSKNTFGWQRAEVVGTLLNTVMLTTLTFTIFIETIQRFIEPVIIKDPKLLLGVGAGGLLINIIGLILLGGHHGHSHGGNSPVVEVLIKDQEVEQMGDNDRIDLKLVVADGDDNHDNDHDHSHGGGGNHKLNKDSNHKEAKGHGHSSGYMNLRAVFLHVLADFFGSVAVVISALLIWLVPNSSPNSAADKWKGYIDPSISLLIVFLILISTIPLLKKSALILLQSVPKEVSVSQLKECMEKIDGIDKVHDLHVWLLQSDVIIGTVHIRCTNERYVEVSKKAKQLFHDFNIHCTTIQAEFNEHAEDSYSNRSADGLVNNGNEDHCVLSCDDKSNLNGTNECKAKQSCCPMRIVSGTPKAVEPTEVTTHLLQHQQSAPCLTSMTATHQQSSTSSQHLEDIFERLQ